MEVLAGGIEAGVPSAKRFHRGDRSKVLAAGCGR